MSQVVTMLCGNLEESFFKEEPENDLSRYSGIKTISEEESVEFPLLSKYSQGTSRFTIGRPSNSLEIESGRVDEYPMPLKQ